MQDRERELDARQSLGRMDVHRDAAAVVGDGDAVVAMDRDLDVFSTAEFSRNLKGI